MQVNEIREHPIAVLVVAGIILFFCATLVQPLTKSLIVAGLMVLIYLATLIMPLGNCIEMGLGSIILTIVVCLNLGALESWQLRKEAKLKATVEQTNAPYSSEHLMR